jgi:hypothetical protein
VIMVPFVEGADILPPFFLGLGVQIEGWVTPPRESSSRFGLKHASAVQTVGQLNIGVRLSAVSALRLSGQLAQAVEGDEYRYHLNSPAQSREVINAARFYYDLLANVHFSGRELFDMKPLSLPERSLSASNLSEEELRKVVHMVSMALKN